MNINERRRLFNKLCCTSHHLHRQGYEGQQNEDSSKDGLASKVAPVRCHQMYDQLWLEKEAMVNRLCQKSIACLEKCLNEIEAKGRKSEIITNTEAQRMTSGTVRSSGNAKVNESNLNHKQTPQKGSSCLGRAKKKLFPPDVEPDDDDDEVHCKCCTCKKVSRNLEEKVFFSEPQSKSTMPSCRPEAVHPRRLEFPTRVNTARKETPTKVYGKRKIDEDEDVVRSEKRPKFDLLDISTFEPRACSTPYVNKSRGNLRLFRRPAETQFSPKAQFSSKLHFSPNVQFSPKTQIPPQRQFSPKTQIPPQRQFSPKTQIPPQRQFSPKTQIPPQRQFSPKTQLPVLGAPHAPSTAKIRQDLTEKMPRILTIEDFSQADENDVVLYLSSNKPGDIEDTENLSQINDDQNSVASDLSEEESKLNRTFTISPNKGSSSPMFTSSSATPFEIPVIDSSPNSPAASLIPQPLPPPDPPAPQLANSKRSDTAADSESFPRTTRSGTKRSRSDRTDSVRLNEASPSKSSPLPTELPEEQSMLPTASSSNLEQSHVEKEETELMDWCVNQHGSSYQLSGYIFDTLNRKFVRHEPGTIATRHRASLVETSDGKLYRLVNPFVKSRSNITDAFGHFRNGFPENWKEVLDKLVDKKTKEPEIKKPVRATKVKEVKKPNKSLNSSFFDLPDGKGTPETPLRREDLRQTRKSGRYVVPPLAYWKNQRIMIDPKTNETLIIDGGRNFLDTKVVHFAG